MRKFIFFLVTLLFSVYLPAQITVVFHENFELPTLGDSVISSTDPAGGNPWSISTNLKNSGLRADSNKVQIGKTVYLTTNSFSTVGNSVVYLNFSQICKLYYTDGGQIELSVDGGINWISLGTNEYRGSGSLITIGGISKFSESSYNEWLAGDTLTKPTNAWWKSESFDISAIAANQANVKVRFKFYGSGNAIGSGRYGWLLDDINVIASSSELTPPVINVIAYPTDTAYFGGPYNVSAYVKDASGIDTVYIMYKAGNGALIQLGMQKSPTIDSLYTAGIPYVGYGKAVIFNVMAKDASPAHNLAKNPISGDYSFFPKYSPGGNVIVGTSTFTQNYPFKSNADSTKSASIYLASSINKFGIITQLQWYVSSAQSATIPIKIYIKQSPVSTFTADNWSNLINGATLVYSGSQSFNTTGWKTITLTTPFYYNAGNIFVFCEANYGGAAGAGVTPSFQYSTGPHQYFPSSLSTIGTVTTSRPNITLGFLTYPTLTQDAGITQITNPIGSVTASSSFNINIKIKNFGSSLLSKANVYYAIDGNNPVSTIWTGSLQKDSITDYTAGNLTLPVGMHTLKIWTDMPNDSIDQNNINDTVNTSFYACAGALNGIYTIGGAGANFTTFSDAYSAMVQCGINGAVVFKVNPGTYSEQLTFAEINGASPANTITFQSATGDSTSVILSYGSAANWIVKLNGADYFSFKNIKFVPTDSIYSTAVVLTNGACNNKFIGNLFVGYAGTVATQTSISIEGSAIANNNNLIQGNYFVKGTYGISAKGIFVSKLKNTIIKRNIFDNSSIYGIYAQYVDSTLIDSNTIATSNVSTNKYGIYLQYADVLNTITKNTVNLSGGTNMYGILIESSISADTTKGLISNNFVSILNGSALAYGIRLNTVTKFKIYANSVVCTGNSITNTRAVNIVSASSGIDLKNNNLLSNKYPVYVEGTSVTSSDYNNYFSTGTTFAYWNTTDYTNLSTLVSASLKDSNSVSVNPNFFSNTDLHTFNIYLSGKGIMLSDVLVDIDGAPRLNPPCIGADEYLASVNDASLIAIIQPASACGLTSTETVSVVIKNVGITTVTPGNCTAAFKIVGGNSITPEIINRTIAPGDTIHYTFTAKANLSVATTHTDSTFKLIAWNNLSSDFAHANDSSSINVLSSYLPSSPVTGSNQVIPYASTAVLTATSQDTLQWFDVPTGGSYLATGSQFTTPVLLDTTTFYVQARAIGSRINYALIANAANGSGGGYGYTPDLYNDGIIPAYGTSGSGVAGWTTSNSWIEYTWTYPVSFKKVVFYKDTKPMSTCTFQYWDGSAYVDFYTYNNSNINDSVTFPVVTTTKLRFYNISGALANPNFREIQVFASDGNSNSGCASARVPVTVYTSVYPHEAGIAGIITPSGCSLYNVAISIKIFNHGSITMNASNTTVSYKIDNGNFITAEALNVTILPFDTVQYTFNTLANFAAPTADRLIKVTAIVNTQSDAMHSNDTLVKYPVLSQYTPPAPIVSNVSINNGTTATLNATTTSGTLNWYHQLNGGNIIGQNSPFVTPVLYTTDTFYVEAKAYNTSIITLGNGTAANATTAYPAPYGGRYNGAKHQMLITKAELNAFGIQAGPITSLAFDVAIIGATPLQNFQIKMGHTALNALSIGNWVPNTIQVYSNFAYSDTLGWNTHNFTTPFVWNGIDNVVVEVCFDNINIYGSNASMRYTPTSFNSVALTYYSGSGVCSSSASTELYVNRPNMKIKGTVPGCASVPRVPVIVNVALPPQNDAGVLALVNPVTTTPSGISTPIKVKIKNYGQAHLTSVAIAWTLNNVAKPVYNFTGNIAPGADSTVTISNETFSGGYYCLKAWTLLPNNVTDSVLSNDTLAKTCFNACLNGTYTIGSSIANNFPSFNAAIIVLRNSGICGNVTFLVDSGTYTEQVRIPDIAGVSASSTVTFRSATNDSTKVILQYKALGQNNSHTLKLDSADFIRIEKMTIKALDSTYGNVIELDNGAHNNIITNCSIEMPDNSSPYYTGILDQHNADTYNKFQSNTILNGYNGITSLGGKKGTEIRYNRLINFKYYGINSGGNDSVMIIRNELVSKGLIGNTTYALYCTSCNNAIQIIGNKITLTSPYNQFGLYMYNTNGSATSHGLVANNMIALSEGGTSSTNNGLYFANVSYQDFYYNSVSIAVPSLTNGRALYAFGSTFVNLKNNIFVNTGGGFAYYVQSPAAIVQSEYNDIYTSGSVLGYWNGNQATLLDLQTVSTKNANSLSVIPGFTSLTDLNLISTAMSALATPIPGITDDIDGSPRDAVHPCIGADEIPLLQHDAGVTFISRPNAVESEGASIPVKVAVKNFGTSPITSMTVSYVLNNGAPVNFTYSGSIPYLGVDTVTFPANITVTAGNNTICAYTTLTGDINTFNDKVCKNYFSSPIYDAQLTKILPITQGCGLTTDTVRIIIHNNGIMPVSGGLTARYQKLGGTAIVTETVNATIAVGTDYIYTFSTPVNLAVTSSDSLYKIKAWVTLVNDNIHENDTDTLKVSSLRTPSNPVSVTSISIPYATSTSLSATSIDNAPLKWFNDAVGGTSFYTGSPYNTSMLFATDTFYVEANTTSNFNAIVGTGPNTSGDPFSTLNGFTTSVSIYNASEIGGFGFINQLSWDAFKGDTVNIIPVKVYVKQTSQSFMNPDTLTNLLSGATLVYVGNKMFNITGWNSINFTSPYYYSADNLMVICQVNYGGSGVYPSAIFRETSIPGSKFHQVFKADNTPPTGAGVIYAARPNIKITGYNTGCVSQRIAAIVTVGTQPAYDAGISSIITPVSGTNLSSHDSVKVMVKNYGSLQIYNFTVNYKLGNNAVVSQLMTDTIASGSSKLFTFSQAVNLFSYSQQLTFNLSSWTSLSGDPTHQNDTARKTIINNPLVYCISTATATGNSDIGNVKFAGINNGNPLPVFYNPAANQMYNNYTALAPAQIHLGRKHPISLSIISSGGNLSGLVNVYIDYNHNGIWDLPQELAFSSFYGEPVGSTVTGFINVPDTALPGLCRMRIVADEGLNAPACGTYNYGETEDYTVNINPPLIHDGALSKIGNIGTFVPYSASNTQNLKFIIRNDGLNTLTSASLNIKVNNDPVITQAWNGSLQSLALDSIMHNITLTTGMNSITAYISGVSGDSNQYNDTLQTKVFKEYIATLPYLDNFETNKYWFATDTVNGLYYYNLWIQGIPVTSHPSLNTAHSPSNAWITQLSGDYPFNNISVLYTPVFDISIMKADTLKFWQWREFNYGTNAYIEYKDMFGSWLKLGVQNDTSSTNWYNNSINTWNGLDTNWALSTYRVKNLSNLGNTVQFRFVFTSSTTVNTKKGWAIDDFELTLASSTNDAGVIAITSPAATSNVGDIVTVTVNVKNFGTNTLTNIPVRYRLGNGAVATGILAGPLSQGQTLPFTFMTPTFQVGNLAYDICAWTSVAGDNYTQNDSSCKHVNVNLAANDVGIYNIVQPAANVSTGNLTVKVLIKNYGTTTQTSIPLSYIKGTSAAVNETWTGNLISGDTVAYSFLTQLNVPIGSSFVFCSFTTLSNDAYKNNDTLCKTVTITNGINEISETDFWLGQNTPNPATGITKIEYNLPSEGDVKFEIINLYGQKVYSSNQKYDAGKHSIDLKINELSAGIYYYSLEFKGKRLVKKMIVSK
ncbi:MAG: GEVED domain-containing protein [Bacteroidetes bacterium]|nr:GEVED domain-containing protein [Bacteroidota bacterium]